jgi:hypothetical protein
LNELPYSGRWLDSAGEYEYPAGGGAFPDLVCRVLYGQSREAPRLLFAMAEELGELADDLLERRELRRQNGSAAPTLDAPERAFLMVCRDLRAPMEACVALHAARALRSPPTRAPGLYAWSLVTTLIRRFEHRDGDAYFRALCDATSHSAPVAWESLSDAVVTASARMAASEGWPDAKDAHALYLHFQNIEPVWARHAAALHHNGSRPQGTSQRGLARRAASACRLARHTFARLSSQHGWLRLHIEYLLELLAGVDRLAREGHPLEEYADVAIHELAYVLGSASGSLASETDVPYPFADNHSGGPAERKRIERGRARCLGRWLVHEPDPFWDDYDIWGALEEIGSPAAASEVSSRE